MPAVTIDLGKLTDWIGISINALGFAGAIFALLLTRKNISLLIAQIRSQSYHSQIEAHKTLFFPIIQDKELSRLLLGNKNTEEMRSNMLSSMLINHASRIHNDFINDAGPKRSISEFVDDAIDLFSIPLVRDRWEQVKAFHDLNFVLFIDKNVIPRIDGTF